MHCDVYVSSRTVHLEGLLQASLMFQDVVGFVLRLTFNHTRVLMFSMDSEQLENEFPFLPSYSPKLNTKGGSRNLNGRKYEHKPAYNVPHQMTGLQNMNMLNPWNYMNVPNEDSDKMYENMMGSLPRLTYRDTYNIVSNNILKWSSARKFELVTEFLKTIFGEELLITTDSSTIERLTITKGARAKADKLFGISSFHADLKKKRFFVYSNTVKQRRSNEMMIPQDKWQEFVSGVQDPERLLEQTMNTIIPSVLTETYLKYLESR